MFWSHRLSHGQSGSWTAVPVTTAKRAGAICNAADQPTEWHQVMSDQLLASSAVKDPDSLYCFQAFPQLGANGIDYARKVSLSLLCCHRERESCCISVSSATPVQQRHHSSKFCSRWQARYNFMEQTGNIVARRHSKLGRQA